MPRSLMVERENLPEVVQGWLKAAKIGELDVLELVFTEGEILLRKPLSEPLRDWARGATDRYDRAFRELIGL